MKYPERAKRIPNLTSQEQTISLLAGVGLLLAAIRQSWLLKAPLLLGSGYLFWRGFSGRDPIYQSLGISYKNGNTSTLVRVQHSVTINRPREEVFRYWADLNNLPNIMRHLESVVYTDGDNGHSHWVARAPLGRHAKWDARITEMRENELIAWHSLPGSEIENSGRVTFKNSLDHVGTEVYVDLSYRSPLGLAGAIFGRVAAEEPDKQVKDDLHRFKRILETGEDISVKGQPSGRIAMVEMARHGNGDGRHAAERHLAEMSDQPAMIPSTGRVKKSSRRKSKAAKEDQIDIETGAGIDYKPGRDLEHGKDLEQ